MDGKDPKNLPEGYRFTGNGNLNYEIKEKLGEGTFSTVYRVICLETSENYALKIGKIQLNTGKFHQLLDETNMYKYIKKNVSEDDLQYFGNFIDNFIDEEDELFCIILDLYPNDVFYHIKKSGFKGFSLIDVQRILRDFASGINILHKINIIHTDLKPENLIITKEGITKIIDFGGSIPVTNNYSGYVQSRFYRAPETILKYKLTQAIDVWSFGCIAFEIFFGLPLFPGKSSLHMLQLMQIRLGKFPRQIIHSSPCGKDFFDEENVKEIDHVSDHPYLFNKTLKQLILSRPKGSQRVLMSFYNLVSKCLDFNVEERAKPDWIINHSFLHLNLP